MKHLCNFTKQFYLSILFWNNFFFIHYRQLNICNTLLINFTNLIDLTKIIYITSFMYHDINVMYVKMYDIYTYSYL